MFARQSDKTACSFCLLVLAGISACVDGFAHPATSPDKKLMRREEEDGALTESRMQAVATREVTGHAIDLDIVCSHPSPTNASKWTGLSAMANVLNSLNAPWNLHGGALLGLARSCSIFDYDLDFAVERQWMQDNHEKVEEAILAAGFTRKPDYEWPGGRLGELSDQSGGYEEKFYTRSFTGWSGWSQKIGQAFDSLHLLHDEKVPVDVFTIERFKDHYMWDLWTADDAEDNHTGNETDHKWKLKKNTCYSKSNGTKSFSWLGVNVTIPVPIEDVLTSAYGPNFLTPAPWTWDKQPFTVGSCKAR